MTYCAQPTCVLPAVWTVTPTDTGTVFHVCGKHLANITLRLLRPSDSRTLDFDRI